MLMQYEAFGLLGDTSVAEVVEHLHVGKQMARKYFGTLEAYGLVEKQHKRNPVTFALAYSFKDNYGIKMTDERNAAV